VTLHSGTVNAPTGAAQNRRDNTPGRTGLTPSPIASQPFTGRLKQLSQEQQALVEQHLNLAEAAKACGVSRRTMYAWRNLGIGPRSFKITERRLAYRVSDINAYLSDRMAATSRGGA